MAHHSKTFHLGIILLLPVLVIVSMFLFVKSPAQDARRKQPVPVRLTDDLRFLPNPLTIKTGDTIEWENVSRFMHTVTADPAKATRAESARLPPGAAAFDSGDIEPGKKFLHTFVIPGTYRYFCIPYEAAGMVGEIEVLPVSVGKK